MKSTQALSFSIYLKLDCNFQNQRVGLKQQEINLKKNIIKLSKYLYIYWKLAVHLGMNRCPMRNPGIDVYKAFVEDEGTVVMSQQTIDNGTLSTVVGEVYNPDSLLSGPTDQICL